MTAGFILGYSLGLEMFEKNYFELRPGVLIGDTDLFGVDLGLQVRSYFYKQLFLIAGIQLHKTFGSEFSDSHVKTEGQFYIYPGVSIGVDLSNKISVFAGYYLSEGKDWRFNPGLRNERGLKSIQEKLDDLFKIGFEYNF